MCLFAAAATARRDAGRLYGTPKKNRSGRRGQMVKVLLQRAGLKVIEVGAYAVFVASCPCPWLCCCCGQHLL